MSDFWALGVIAAVIGMATSMALVIAVLRGERGRLRSWYWTAQWARVPAVLPFGFVYLAVGFPENPRFLLLICSGPAMVWGVCLWFAWQRVGRHT